MGGENSIPTTGDYWVPADNAWQYFLLHALASTIPTGMVALVIPFEGVSRPSCAGLRRFINENSWNVWVYRLPDETFDDVLTTSSITIIDKAAAAAEWRFFEELDNGSYRQLGTATGGKDGVLGYSTRAAAARGAIRAKRGLSPGTQDVLTLTEGERVRAGLKIAVDVVPCVTSLRHLDGDLVTLTDAGFKRLYRDAGKKCWLIRTDRKPSSRLQLYLDGIDPARYNTATCLDRTRWWQFDMPTAPSLLVASGFRGGAPKAIINGVDARAVGGIFGIYGVGTGVRRRLLAALRETHLADRVVRHSNGFMKLEVNQLNTLLQQLM